jgi:hypothetical protein
LRYLKVAEKGNIVPQPDIDLEVPREWCDVNIHRSRRLGEQAIFLAGENPIQK